VARIVGEMLKRRFGAKRVVVFGSLARKTVFTLWSDIDLAVWGIASEEYYHAAGAAMDTGLETGIRVDVVDVDECGRNFPWILKKKGLSCERVAREDFPIYSRFSCERVQAVQQVFQPLGAVGRSLGSVRHGFQVHFGPYL
jgi:predicted nucleotidyltransferase